MTTVLIGGSRTVSRLNPQLRQRLDYIIKCGARIVIGDSNGAERAVQQYLAAQGYRQVAVYCVRECLNNLGNWPAQAVGMPKERALLADARCGVMLWDGKSQDTLRILRELLSVGKRALVYFAPSKTFYNLATEEDLDEFLGSKAGSA
jgi:hypothetical protein